MQLLTAMFQDRIISLKSDFEWPPRSPDLTAPDFWLWGYLKDKFGAYLLTLCLCLCQKSGAVKSGERGGHSKSDFREIIRS